MTNDGMRALGERARAAGRVVALAHSEQKDEALAAGAQLLEERCDEILTANQRDVARAVESATTPTVIDRLRLNEDRISRMAGGLRQVAALADPVGETVTGWVRPNGLDIRQVRVPLGVVGVIYENRPNVTSDAAGLCIKSGNAAFLRGSSAALASNEAIAAALRDGLVKVGLPADVVVLVDDTSRQSARHFMRLTGLIDCLIPRGGPSLIQAVKEEATVPYVIDGDGNCHVYVDATADIAMAVAIVVNGKTQRPGVCNATESLVLDAAVAERFLTKAIPALAGVRLVGDDRARRLGGPDAIGVATEEDFASEFLDLKLSIAVVDDLSGAIAHVNRYGSGHSEVIVTRDITAATRFCREVDAAAVLVNASSRFVDGEEFGFGAEIGISTQKLHARGPMGLRQLTTTKYVVVGDGQTRG